MATCYMRLLGPVVAAPGGLGCDLYWPFGYLGRDWVLTVSNGDIIYEWNIDPFWIFGHGWRPGMVDEDDLGGYIPMFGRPCDLRLNGGTCRSRFRSSPGSCWRWVLSVTHAHSAARGIVPTAATISAGRPSAVRSAGWKLA